MGQDNGCLAKRVVNSIVSHLKENEKDCVGKEYSVEFQEEAKLELFFKLLVAPHSELLESIDLGNTQQLYKSPYQQHHK